MPTMKEIYDSFAAEYDQLVAHEDYQENLPKVLEELFDFKNKTVAEFGTGTGRVTDLYIDKVKKAYCFDRSEHMLDKARSNLKKYEDKIDFKLCENSQIHSLNIKVDIVIEGWSFGHSVSDDLQQINDSVKKLVKDCVSLVNENGAVIIIETLGSNSKSPVPPSKKLNTFYNLLENQHGFKKAIVATDYKFANFEDADRIFCFFFGTEIGKGIRENKLSIVPEFTGVWIKEDF